MERSFFRMRKNFERPTVYVHWSIFVSMLIAQERWPILYTIFYILLQLTKCFSVQQSFIKEEHNYSN